MDFYRTTENTGRRLTVEEGKAKIMRKKKEKRLGSSGGAHRRARQGPREIEA